MSVAGFGRSNWNDFLPNIGAAAGNRTRASAVAGQEKPLRDDEFFLRIQHDFRNETTLIFFFSSSECPDARTWVDSLTTEARRGSILWNASQITRDYVFIYCVVRGLMEVNVK